ncbi:hypothetical protein FOL47_001614 [Perkinsus chesapeaki]|uniref:Uncharacterized protein n=1 Tax=Perkinsus chesapeaki TaxID=330153 RepID=A0A7J6N0J4_PERCH|nr:hypothetical protein FOL47_001614 [Perkinsus chesapeaki]
MKVYHPRVLLDFLFMVWVKPLEIYGSSIRFVVNVTTYCDLGLKDHRKDALPCWLSPDQETRGLVLPGMDYKTLSMIQEVTVEDGARYTVTAMPSYPYQYFLTTETASHSQVEQLLENQAILLANGEADPSMAQIKAVWTEEAILHDGWVFDKNVTTQNRDLKRWTKTVGEFDKETKFNHSALCHSGVGPNRWYLYTDENDYPVRSDAVNTCKNQLHQQAEFVKFEVSELLGGPSASIREDILQRYEIRSTSLLRDSNSDSVPPVGKFYMNSMVPHPTSEENRRYFENGKVCNWLEVRQLRGNAIDKDHIDYFTIEKDTAAYAYFNADRPRQLLVLLNLVYPTGCKEAPEKYNYCLFVEVADAIRGIRDLSVNAGLKIVDINDPKRTLWLQLIAQLNFDTDNNLIDIDLALQAQGCVVLWKLGSGIELWAGICMDGRARVQNVTQQGRVIDVRVSMSLVAGVALPIIGDIGDLVLQGAITATVRRNTAISGTVMLIVSFLVVGFGLGLDITTTTNDIFMGTWEWSSGFDLLFWVNVIFWQHTWSPRYVIWKTGPIHVK